MSFYIFCASSVSFFFVVVHHLKLWVLFTVFFEFFYFFCQFCFFLHHLVDLVRKHDIRYIEPACLLLVVIYGFFCGLKLIVIRILIHREWRLIHHAHHLLQILRVITLIEVGWLEALAVIGFYLWSGETLFGFCVIGLIVHTNI